MQMFTNQYMDSMMHFVRFQEFPYLSEKFESVQKIRNPWIWGNWIKRSGNMNQEVQQFAVSKHHTLWIAAYRNESVIGKAVTTNLAL